MSYQSSDNKKKGETQVKISNFKKKLNKEKAETKANSSETIKDRLSLNAKFLFKDLEKKPHQFPDNSLFEKIKNNLDKLDYKEDELIKDMNDLLENTPFIEKFNNHVFIKESEFDIFDKLEPSKIYFNLNLLNFINIINAINYFTLKDADKFPKILHKLGINFSYVEMDKMEDVVAVILTPKTSALYNYISTHGGIGIENKEYRDMVTQFCIDSEKCSVDFGYCYEDFSVSYLSEIIGKDSFKIIPNVMYYIRDTLGERLKELKLVDIPKKYRIYKSPEISLYSGFNETDFFISMLKTVEIPMNLNFRSLKNIDVKITNCNIKLEKDNIYIFELKVSIDNLLEKISEVEEHQAVFKEALNNVKINNNCPFSKNFTSILMCDNNPIVSQKKAQKKDSLLRNKNLIYSGFQLGITYLNHINTNIRDMHCEIDSLKGQITEQNETIKEVKLGNSAKYNKIIELIDDNIKKSEQINGQNDNIINQKLEILKLEIKNSAQDKEIEELKLEKTAQDNKINEQDNKIEELKRENTAQDKKIEELKRENTAQDKKIKVQDKKIDELKSENIVQNDKIKEQDKKMKERDEKIKEQDKKIKEQDKKIDALIKENNGLREEINNLSNDLKFIKQNININSEANTEINNNELYKLCLKLIENMFGDESVSIKSLLKEGKISLLNKDLFKTVFKSFESMLKEVLKFNDLFLYSMVKSLLNEKENTDNALEVRKLLKNKIKKNDACSPYYKALNNLLFGIDDENTCEIFKILEQSKINYIKKLVGFIEIFDVCQNIKDIELKLQGAIMYIILNFCDNEKWNSLVKQVYDNDDNNRIFMITIISSLNPNNDD